MDLEVVAQLQLDLKTAKAAENQLIHKPQHPTMGFT
jgi:hypothetical protein